MNAMSSLGRCGVVHAIVGVVVVTLVLAGDARAQCQYEVTIIQAPECPPFGSQPTIGTGINSHAQLVGYYCVCLCESDQAFLWTPESGMEALDLAPDDFTSRAYDINDSGQIVGIHNILGDGFGNLGFLLDGDIFTDLGTVPGGNFSEALAVNEKAQVVGYSGNIVTGDPPLQAFIWHDGVMVDLGPTMNAESSRAYDINESAQVTGWRREHPGGEQMAFMWENDVVMDLGPIPGGFSSQGSALNNFGQVVGFGKLPYEGPGQLTHPFLWMDGEMMDLGGLPVLERCIASDINDAGQIVGTCSRPDHGFSRAFIWEGGLMTNLNALIPADSDVQLWYARAINNAGQITCSGGTSGDAVAVLLTPPELPIGDLTRDCLVNAGDLAVLLGSWGPCPPEADCPADLNGDGTVGPQDLAVLLSNWAPGPEVPPFGGCRFCDPEGSPNCVLSSGADCEAVGGAYLGDGSDCDGCFAIACGFPDEACCEIVCAVDPVCCEGVWDEWCAWEAEHLCEGCVDPWALAILLGNWGTCADCEDCPGDMNGDCVVDPMDLAILLGSLDCP